MEDESELDLSSTAPLTYSELADKLCVIYMAMGMPCEEYWRGDYTRLEYYRKAYEMQQERANHDAWIQGAYVYDALCAVSPVLHAFAKPNTKPLPYHKKPYGAKADEQSNAITAEQAPKKSSEEIQAINASARFASFMTQWNKKFNGEGGDVDGGND